MEGPKVTRRSLLRLGAVCAGCAALAGIGAVDGGFLARSAYAAQQHDEYIPNSEESWGFPVDRHWLDGRTAYCLHPGPIPGEYYAQSNDAPTDTLWTSVKHPAAVMWLFHHGWTDGNQVRTYNGQSFSEDASIYITQMAIWAVSSDWGSDVFSQVTDGTIRNAVTWLCERALAYENSYGVDGSRPEGTGVVRYYPTTGIDFWGGSIHYDDPQPLISYGTPNYGSVQVIKAYDGRIPDAFRDQEFSLSIKVHHEFTERYAGLDGSYRHRSYPLVGNFAGNVFDANGVCAFTLKVGESKTFSSLPAGYDYEVTESLSGVNWMDPTYVNARGHVAHNQVVGVTVTNKLRSRYLTLEKGVAL